MLEQAVLKEKDLNEIFLQKQKHTIVLQFMEAIHFVKIIQKGKFAIDSRSFSNK